MEISRGELVIAALPGAYGKPRPALVMQSDAFGELASLTVLPLTSELHDFPLFRITLDPNDANGLAIRSQVMVDKAVTVPKDKIGQRIGRLEPETMRRVGSALARFLEIG